MKDIKVKVTNEGGRSRSRLGKRFLPGNTVPLNVNKNGLLILKAVRGFKVEVINKKKPDYKNMKVEQFLEVVKSGELSVSEAIAIEVTGRNRPTLLNELESLEQ